jgi:hypothetical protein
MLKMVLPMVLLLMFVGAASAAVPAPLVEIGFQADSLLNTGTVAENGYITDGSAEAYAEGVAGPGSRALVIDTGDLAIGQLPLDGGGMRAALEGLKSYTVCMWYKSTQGTINANPYFQRYDTSNWTYPMRQRCDAYGRAFRAYVNNVQGPDTPYGWFSNTENWTFIAMTYDFTTATDNMGYHRNIIGSDFVHPVYRSLSAGTDLDGGEYPLELLMNAGMIDNVRVFGSKVDGSGALNRDQVTEIYNADQAAEIPEPATMLLLGLGGLALIKRRK